MKKLISLFLLTVTLLGTALTITNWDWYNLPVFKGDLSKVNYKIIETNGEVWIIEIDGVTYIVKVGEEEE